MRSTGPPSHSYGKLVHLFFRNLKQKHQNLTLRALENHSHCQGGTKIQSVIADPGIVLGEMP